MEWYTYVDLGTGVDDDSNPVASEVLVFMVVSLKENWKIPCGYFLINGLSGVERANLVQQCISKLYDVGVNIVSLTCDGPSCHFSMMAELGVKLNPNELKAWFSHPSNPARNVYVLFDVCHMIKLVRNTLGAGHILVDPNGNKIFWSFVSELHKLQETEGVHLANKLQAAHINWQTQKMKVNLAVQAVSASVAAAIEFCNTELKLPQFSGSEATVKFLRIFDHLFDILNNRNPLGRGYKAPLRMSNVHLWRPFLNDTFVYIKNLKDTAGQLMTSSRRKTPFIGFLCAIQSTLALFDSYVSENGLKYLLAYKLSQDHLELFFAAVRTSFGSNNNPTARQFAASYKWLLIRHEIQGTGGNASALDSTGILFLTRDHISSSQSVDLDTSHMSVIKRYDLQPRKPLAVDHDYADLCNVFSLAMYKEYVIAYIAGYVVRMVTKVLYCETWIAALTAQDEFLTLSYNTFVCAVQKPMGFYHSIVEYSACV